MGQLLPDRLKDLWSRVDTGQLTSDAAQQRQDQWLAEYREVWTWALATPDTPNLKQALMTELAAYLGSADIVALEERCRLIGEELKGDWQGMVTDPRDRRAVERFYDRSQGYLLDLMWWHTLEDDASPLASVLALDFARRCPGDSSLDFGGGVGSGAILFARHGYAVAQADISSTLLDFSKWRFARRQLAATTINLTARELAREEFDFITAMDVFEHLADPIEAVDRLASALKPGGYLFGRFAADPDPARPQHIVFDFAPTFQRLAFQGLTEVWKDVWLWGHQVFQKPG